MQLLWVFAPFMLLFLLLVLERVEARVVAPIDRAAMVRRLIDGSTPEALETRVAELFAPLTSAKRFSRF